jgi:flagellar biosynthesis/type III secretory pathway M-ring protein FliF/YscJ
MQLIRTLAIVLVVIIALLLAARSARRARRLTATPINIGELTMARRGAISELASAMEEVELPIIPDRNESTMGEIAAIADRRPEDVANVLRSWLAESQARH